MTFEHKVRESENEMRLDKLLTTIIKDKSRSQIQTWIKEHNVTVNGRRVKVNYKCRLNDLIQWTIPEEDPVEIIPENIPLEIVYEDDDLFVINKRKGIVVHPSPGHRKGTLVHGLLHYYPKLLSVGEFERPGIVHRLDKDTSGLLIVAKNNRAHLELSKQFAQKEIERTYEAIVHGTLSHDRGKIDAPIGRNPNNRQQMAVVTGGRQAITHFRVITRYENYTYVECQLETGRTHQIRVHMKYINHPLVGDPKYCSRRIIHMNGQALHAKELKFVHPITKEQLHFQAPPPKAFRDFLTTLDKKS